MSNPSCSKHLTSSQHLNRFNISIKVERYVCLIFCIINMDSHAAQVSVAATVIVAQCPYTKPIWLNMLNMTRHWILKTFRHFLLNNLHLVPRQLTNLLALMQYQHNKLPSHHKSPPLGNSRSKWYCTSVYFCALFTKLFLSQLCFWYANNDTNECSQILLSKSLNNHLIVSVRSSGYVHNASLVLRWK